MDRRRFLASAAGGAVFASAGCLSVLDGDDGGGTVTGSYAGVEDGTVVGSSGQEPGPNVPDHAAAAGVLSQPRIGNFDRHTIIAFEDPSCSRCRHFEENIVPDIHGNLLSEGSATLVARTYPVVYQWGEPATHALEATYDRSERAFWSLYGHYFAEQGSFGTDNILEKTAAYLNEQTSVDGEDVVADVETEAYADAVQADLDAGMDADAGQTTPILFLYRDGEFATSISGTPSYDTIANTLGEG